MRDDGLLTTPQKVFGYPTLAVGLALDLVVHATLGTILFLELPREWTLSGRLWRLSTTGTGWRQSLALALRAQLLDSADPSGEHRGGSNDLPSQARSSPWSPRSSSSPPSSPSTAGRPALQPPGSTCAVQPASPGPWRSAEPPSSSSA